MFLFVFSFIRTIYSQTPTRTPTSCFVVGGVSPNNLYGREIAKQARVLNNTHVTVIKLYTHTGGVIIMLKIIKRNFHWLAGPHQHPLTT